MERKCRTCIYCVIENENKIGKFHHDRDATEKDTTFCLMKDFFTMCHLDDEACEDYFKDREDAEGDD